MKPKTVYLSRETLNKFKKFESLRAQILRFVYYKTNDLEADLKMAFNNLPDHFHVFSSLEIMDVIYDKDDGLGFTNDHWMDCFGTQIVCYIRPYTYEDGKKIKKYIRRGFNKYSLIPFFKSSVCSAESESVPAKMVLDAFNQFLNGIDRYTSQLIDNYNHIKLDRYKKEFGLCIDKSNFYQTVHKEDTDEKNS